jgi:hypothetical protein
MKGSIGFPTRIVTVDPHMMELAKGAGQQLRIRKLTTNGTNHTNKLRIILMISALFTNIIHIHCASGAFYFRLQYEKGVIHLGSDTPPLGAVQTGGVGDIFHRIHKDFKDKSSDTPPFRAGSFISSSVRVVREVRG